MPETPSETRVRSPHLVRQEDPLAYTWADTWDASTPEELHTACYGAWVGGFSRNPQWAAAQTKTLFLTKARYPDLETLVWQVARVPSPLVLGTAFARRLEERRVVRRAWAHIALDLPQSAAIMLSMKTLGPTIFLDGPGWGATVFPALGPSSSIDLRNAEAVSQLYGGLLLEILPLSKPAWQVWLDSYGFNPIPEFKRLFELTQL